MLASIFGILKVWQCTFVSDIFLGVESFDLSQVLLCGFEEVLEGSKGGDALEGRSVVPLGNWLELSARTWCVTLRSLMSARLIISPIVKIC